jgi:hypothetical protein
MPRSVKVAPICALRSTAVNSVATVRRNAPVDAVPAAFASTAYLPAAGALAKAW